MRVENKPLDALNKKIDQQNLVISDLGTIKSKTAIFQDALKDFENSNSYNTVEVSYPDKTVLTATGSNGAILGNFSVTVNTVAKADTWSISGFTATNNSIGVASGGFNITVAGTTYNTVNPPTGVGALGANPTVTDLANWINSLGVDAAAAVVKTTDSSSYVLQIYGTKTGTTNAVSYSGITTGPTISSSQGGAAITESAAVTFKDLKAGDSVTLGGRTFTAGASDATAEQVATDFAAASNTFGTVSGTLSGWALSRSGSVVTFTSTTPTSNISPNLSETVTSGSAPSITTTQQGIAGATEIATVTFKALKAGDSITVAGRTFTAGSSGATEDQVAAAIALTPSSSSGNSVDGTTVGSFSGAITTGWTITGSGSSRTFTYTANTAVTDLTSSATSGSATSITTTEGSSGGTESASVTFTALNAGQRLTLAGLTFTAGTSGATAVQVASAFGGLANGNSAASLNTSKTLGTSAGGTFTAGTVSGWSSSAYSSGSAAITFTASTTGNVTDLTGNFLTASKTTTATDSEITVNSTSFIRSSNVISDVIDGVTLNLFNTSATAQMVNVSRGSDSSEAVIKKMIDTYNDLIGTYKTMTANSYNSDKPGTFANDPTTLSFINEIKARFAKGITYGTAMTSSLSMASMGIDLQIDGVLKFNALTYLDAQAAGLQDKLAQGVTVGYVNSTNNLKEYIDDLIGITGGGGSLTDVITTEKEQISDLFKRQTLLQDKLIKVQNTLVTQYSALNSLLYQLSVTSNSLTSALDALSNNNKN